MLSIVDDQRRLAGRLDDEEYNASTEVMPENLLVRATLRISLFR